jgi:hypothetical protein
VLPAGQRFRLDPGKREQARDDPLDLVAKGLGLGFPRQRGGAQGADDVEGRAGGRARRVDGQVGCAAQLPHPVAADSL